MCAGCHKHGQEQFAGSLFPDVEAAATFGNIYSSNITQHPEFGIGKYTDGELYRLFRTGIKKDGTLALPMMHQFLQAYAQEHPLQLEEN